MSSRLVHPSRLFLASLLVSLVLHGLIAVGFIWLRFPQTPTLYSLPSTIHLEVSHVELSFAETPDDMAAVAPESVPMPQMPPQPEPVVRADFGCLALLDCSPCAPQPDMTDLPKPDEPCEQFEETSITHHSSFVTHRSSQPAPRQATIDAPPKPRQNIRPDYPRSSRLHGEEGDVALEISVTASGAVKDVRVIRSSGFPALDKAAVEAVRAAQFSPATSDGRSAASSARLTLRFRLK